MADTVTGYLVCYQGGTPVVGRTVQCTPVKAPTALDGVCIGDTVTKASAADGRVEFELYKGAWYKLRFANTAGTYGDWHTADIPATAPDGDYALPSIVGPTP